MFQDQPNRDEIVLVGRSSAGKSTPMRELTGYSKFTAGEKPGVTRKPNHFDWNAERFMFTDLPEFGFMSGVDRGTRGAIRTDVVQCIEEHTDNILATVLVVDRRNVIDIIDRRTTEGPIPHDVKMFFFLDELNIPTVITVSKMDKVGDHDERLNNLCDCLGFFPPWKQ